MGRIPFPLYISNGRYVEKGEEKINGMTSGIDFPLR